jgi:hypothetical protein
VKTFQHPLWGFELTYPDSWVHASHEGIDGFAPDMTAFAAADFDSAQAAHLLVRGEWNGYREPIAPRWNQYITKLSIMLGAKRLGSAPFRIGDAAGFEAEIQMPRKRQRRLWVGILARETVILHFTVSHAFDVRSEIEPIATQIIASLKFPPQTEGIRANPRGIPLPPGYTVTDPLSLIPDIPAPENWQAYTGGSDIGALQAFYYRELPNFGWEILEFIPYPNQVEINFARLSIHRDGSSATLGILPTTHKQPRGDIVIQYDRPSPKSEQQA